MRRLRSSTSFLVLVALGLWSAVSSAEPDCKNPDYESQAKQNECAGLHYKIADKALNKQYKLTLGRLPEVKRKQLVSEQREWLRRLEPDCNESVGPREEAGSMWPMEYSECLAQETKARTQVLKRWTAK